MTSQAEVNAAKEVIYTEADGAVPEPVVRRALEAAERVREEQEKSQVDKDKVIPIPVNLPAGEGFPAIGGAVPPPIGFGNDDGGLASMDVEAFMNMRDWLEEAIKAKGAVPDGAGIGCGQADISFALDGCRYSVSIRPLPK